MLAGQERFVRLAQRTAAAGPDAATAVAMQLERRQVEAAAVALRTTDEMQERLLDILV